MHSLRSLLKKLKSPFKKLGSSPEYDWHFSLGCFVVAIVATIAIDAFLFTKLSAPVDQTASNGDLNSITLNRQDISETVESIRKNDLEAANIPDAIKQDPSL